MKKYLLLALCCLTGINLAYAQWAPINLGTAASILSVNFATPDTGFLCSEYFASQTTDGGLTWKTDSEPGAKFYTKILFISPKKGFISIQNGILKTTDGGKTWKQVYYDSAMPSINKICFANDSIGFAADAFNLLVTHDGGNTWPEKIPVKYNIQAPSLYFVNANEGFAPSFSGVVKFSDSGRKAKNITIGNLGIGFNAVRFLSPAIGFISGKGNDLLYKTIDSGNTWQASNNGLIGVSSTHNQIGYNDIYFINQDTGYVCGDQGVIFVTTDGGQHWGMQTTGTDANLRQFYFRSDTDIFVVGDNGTLLHTTNGGFHTTAIQNADQEFSGLNIYPNPMRTYTTVDYYLAKSSKVLITLSDISGRQTTLINNLSQAVGRHQIHISLDNTHIKPGVYIVKFTTENNIETRRMVCY